MPMAARERAPRTDAPAPAPHLQLEVDYWAQGYAIVAGVDEAGRGALAGPVVAAAVVLRAETACAGVWTEVRDSKTLHPAHRERLAAQIREQAAAWAVGAAPASQIDAEGIAAATRAAMTTAILSLPLAAQALIIDWVRLPQLNRPQICMARADATAVSDAAASIVAKVHRDGLLAQLDGNYPAYGFARHKGYGTAEHLAALTRCGPCPEHRLTFAPLARTAGLFQASDECQIRAKIATATTTATA